MVDETRMVTAQNDVAVRPAHKTKPARMLAGERRQSGELFRRKIMVKAGLKSPDRCAARNELPREQAQAVNAARLHAGFDEHHELRQLLP